MIIVIDLDNNTLSNIGARAFNNLTMLQIVYLMNNKLKKLDDSILSGCNKLRNVYLNNNPDLETSNLQSLCPKNATSCKVSY